MSYNCLPCKLFLILTLCSYEFFLTERIKALIKEYLLNEEKSVLSEPLHMPTYQNRIIFCDTRFIDQVQRIQLLSSIQLGAGNEDLAAIVKVKDRRKRGKRKKWNS